MTEAHRRYERKAAEVLHQRVEFDRAADARDLAEWIGHRDARYIYYQAAGEAPMQQQTVFALAVWDPEGARQLLAAECEALGYASPRPAPELLAQAPTLEDVLRAVTDSAACCTESTALEYATLRDGRLSTDELQQLEAQWAAEDRKREVRRAQLRAMAQAPHLTTLRKAASR